MKQRLLIPLLTAFGFAAGFGARMLTESGPSVPPPPSPGAEFVRGGTAAPGEHKPDERRAPTYSEKERAKLLAQIEEIRPKVDEYRKRIDEIAAEFERDLLPLLNAEQREKFLARQKRDADRRAQGEKKVAEATTLSDEQIFQLQQSPLWNALWNVAINWRFERLNRDLKLDEQQQARIRDLLKRRRENFLALVDATPPPSITLSRLATQAEKLRPEPKK